MSIHEEQRKRTEKLIINSFINLAKEKHLSKITVSDIAKRSNLNRGTFYLYYKSKEHLMESLERKILRELNLIINENRKDLLDISYFYIGEPYPIIRLLNNYIFDNIIILNILVNLNDNVGFRNSIQLMLKNIIKESFTYSKNNKANFSCIPDSYKLEMTSSIILSVLVKWIEDPSGKTPDEISKMVMTSLFSSPYEMLGLL